MKTNTTQSAGRIFLAIAAGAALFTGSTAFAQNNAGPAGLCGCDQQRGIEMYVNNVIHDAQQRGITCESAKVYTAACFNVYCSICNDVAAKERCLKAAYDYFLQSPGFCVQQQPVAMYSLSSYR